MKGLWLESIPPEHRQMAVEALDTDNWCRFLHSASSNRDVLELVAFNGDASRERGVYEAVLLYAFMATSLNNRSWSTAELVDMFRRADPIKLRAAGDPLPGAGPFTVYRGVAGRGPARRVRGLSWTDDVEKAAWFRATFAGALRSCRLSRDRRGGRGVGVQLWTRRA